MILEITICSLNPVKIYRLYIAYRTQMVYKEFHLLQLWGRGNISNHLSHTIIREYKLFVLYMYLPFNK